MNKNIYTIIAFLLYMPLAYSQSKYKPVDEFYKRGELFKVIDNDSIQIIASLKEVNKYGHYYRVDLSIANKANRRVEFIPDNIVGEYIYHKKQDKYVKALSFPYEVYAQKVKGHISAAEVFSVIGASLQALSTAPTETVSYSDNTGYRSNLNIYNQADKNRETRENFDRIERYSKFKYEFAGSERDFYLFRETLFPQNAIWGYMMMRYKKCHDFKVIVKLDGTDYTFKWQLVDYEKDRLDKLTDDVYK